MSTGAFHLAICSIISGAITAFIASIVVVILEERKEVLSKSANRLMKSILKVLFSNNFRKSRVDQAGFGHKGPFVAVASASEL